MPPNFLLTEYFFPMSEPIILSDSLRFTFDNPRTEKEIAYAKKFITNQYDSGLIGVFPPHSKEDIITLELIVKSFRDAYSKENEYVRSFFKGYKRKNLFDYLAKMWCVVRFDDEGEVQRIEESYQEMREKGQKGFVLLNEGHPILEHSESLVNYSHLLSLLSHTEGKDYFGRNFIFDPDQLDEKMLIQNFSLHLAMLYTANHDYQTRPGHQDNLSWIFSWLYGSKQILKNALLLEKALKDRQTDKLLYIGNLLGIANRTHDEKIKLLTLTSIIELLVTRNPDTSRFNVEDSINKQFQLKAGVLIYLNNKENDIDFLKKRLKTIYQQRSNVAHGNFGELEDYKRKLSKKEDEEEYFQDLAVDLYSYVRAIIEEYIKDPKFVEFIKAG
jgi:hypothetical protein